MTLFASVLVFAASIFTPTNGTFFTLPGWMPSSVDAEHTPGTKSAEFRRVDPETLAAANAVFEGWFERVYFGSQGDTNDWDAACLGGLDPKSFDFSVGAWFDPAFSWCAPNAWTPTTNRVVETRRFTEWRNARNLAKTMIGGSDDFAFFVTRPGWLTNVWWATTATMEGLDDGFLPVFGWNANVVTSMRRGNCLPTLAQRGDCDVFGLEGEAETPAHFLMDRVIPHGTPQRAAFEELAADDPHSTEGLDKLICGEFEGVVSGGITNATRRLFRDAIGEMDAFEALMDRTIHSPEVVVTNEMTNVTHMAGLTLVGSAIVHYDVGESGFDAIVTNVEWRSEITNRWMRGSIGPGPGTDVVATRFLGTQTGVSKLSLHDAEATAFATEATLAGIVSAARGIVPDGNHLVYVNKVDLKAENFSFVWEFEGVYVGDTGTIPFRQAFFADPTNETQVSTYVERNYTYSRTCGGTSCGPTQPGWEGRTRAANCVAGALEGVMSANGTTAATTERLAWPEEPASGTAWSESYRTKTTPYSTRGALETFLKSIRDDLLQREDALLGVPVELPERVIPVSAGMAANAHTQAVWKAVISNNDPYFPNGFYLGGTSVGGRFTTAWLKLDTSWTYEMPLPQLVEVAKISFTNTGPVPTPAGVEELKPFAADGRWRAVTRTDWNWNANRRK